MPAPPATGRPPTYCSTPCRRAVELEIRRANERLGELERQASHIRLHGRMSCYAGINGPGAALAALDQEIALQRGVLLALLD